MRALSLYLKTEAPLAIRADHAPTGSDSISYIPGTTFVGGLAAVHRALNPDSKDFTRFFLNNEIFFSDLYPAKFEELTNPLSAPVYPVPRTAISCKRHSGFKPHKPMDDPGHGAEDSLRNWALLALSKYEPKLKVLDDLNKSKSCPECGESMDRLTGYYRRVIKPSLERELAKPELKRLQTRTGINRETGTVEEGILYNRVVFEENSEFWGLVTIPDDDKLYDAIKTFLEKTSESHMLRLGTGRTRGLGKVIISIEDLYDHASEEKRFSAFKERIAKLDVLIRNKGEASSLLPSKNTSFFAVTLHSPLILCDKLLRYQGKIDADTLTSALGGKSIPGLKLLYHNAGMKRVTGWNELWGTPKTNEYAIETGSVFLFQHEDNLNDEQQRALFQLEERGLGKRRTEGFGRICISDAFHSEERQ